MEDIHFKFSKPEEVNRKRNRALVSMTAFLFKLQAMQLNKQRILKLAELEAQLEDMTEEQLAETLNQSLRLQPADAGASKLNRSSTLNTFQRRDRHKDAMQRKRILDVANERMQDLIIRRKRKILQEHKTMLKHPNYQKKLRIVERKIYQTYTILNQTQSQEEAKNFHRMLDQELQQQHMLSTEESKGDCHEHELGDSEWSRVLDEINGVTDIDSSEDQEGPGDLSSGLWQFGPDFAGNVLQSFENVEGSGQGSLVLDQPQQNQPNVRLLPSTYFANKGDVSIPVKGGESRGRSEETKRNS